MVEWNRVENCLPHPYEPVWGCFKNGEVFLTYKTPARNSPPSQEWYNIQTANMCLVKWWTPLNPPVFNAKLWPEEDQ